MYNYMHNYIYPNTKVDGNTQTWPSTHIQQLRELVGVAVDLAQLVAALAHHVVDVVGQLHEVLQLLLQLDASGLPAVLHHVFRVHPAVADQLLGLLQLRLDALSLGNGQWGKCTGGFTSFDSDRFVVVVVVVCVCVFLLLSLSLSLCACVRACVCSVLCCAVCVCVRACVRVCVCVCAYVFIKLYEFKARKWCCLKEGVFAGVATENVCRLVF